MLILAEQEGFIIRYCEYRMPLKRPALEANELFIRLGDATRVVLVCSLVEHANELMDTTAKVSHHHGHFFMLHEFPRRLIQRA